MLTVDHLEAILRALDDVPRPWLPYVASMLACLPTHPHVRSTLFEAVHRRAEREGIDCKPSALISAATRWHEIEREGCIDPALGESYRVAYRCVLVAAGVLDQVKGARSVVRAIENAIAQKQ